ncbi:MAG: hypothetical protein MUE60_06725 [Candidatus Eisenbacteria bacterium]|nr:hypothetical protein [Candidatus Eisenbacteria bacterium]
MIPIVLLSLAIASSPAAADPMPSILASTLSTPRLPLSPECASGLSGLAFLSVAGPEGAREVEPWLFISRLPWLFRAQGWEPELLHNGCVSWSEARTAVVAAGESRRPAVWVWVGGAGHMVMGGGTQKPPDDEGCFVAVIGTGAVDPTPPAVTVARSLLETLSWSHAATTSGLSGLEWREDPYVAQGFGAYKRFYADLSVDGATRASELAATATTWAQRRRHAGAFLRWAATILTVHAGALEEAAVCFEQEALCLDPLGSQSELEFDTPGAAKELLWRGLAWHIKGMQTIEPVAFSHAGLDSVQRLLLHAPDEGIVDPESVEPLVTLSRHGLAAIRRIAVRKLIGAPLEPDRIEVLVAALRDEDALVREASLSALEAIRPGNLRDVLWEAYQAAPRDGLHGNGTFHRALVLALTRVREAEVPGLLAMAGSGCIRSDCRPRSLPTWCAEGIIDLMGQASWPYLVSMLKADCAYSREAAAVALGRLGLEEAHAELSAIAFRDSSLSVQCAALGALGRMGSQEAIERLLDLVDSHEAGVPVSAAGGLVEAGEAAIPLIEERQKRSGARSCRALEAVLELVRRGQARSLHTLP